MELIATARFKKAMDRATEAAAYTRKISEIVADLAGANLAFTHPLLQKHESEHRGALLILTSNRGLCGGYNGGVLRLAQARVREAADAGTHVDVEISGKRGIAFLRFQKQPVQNSFTHFEDKPAFGEVEVLADRYINLYVNNRLDRLDVAYTKFLSSSRQAAVVETLLPIGQMGEQPAARAGQGTQQRVEYEFLPTAREILEGIVPAAFKARLFKCFLDAAVSEQIFRMVAMKGATENADEMIGDLSRQYNRARQTQITSELSEIIGGAAALK
jgi:F-type H+-transporting ATPase subunit gamma